MIFVLEAWLLPFGDFENTLEWQFLHRLHREPSLNNFN